MADGIKGGHARQPIAQGAGDGQGQIDVPERLGGFGDARGQLVVLDRAWRFGAVELHAADTEHGQYGHRQHDDSHAAEPLQLLPVVTHGFGQAVQASHDGGAGGGQPGEGFEGGIGKAQVGFGGQLQRQGTGQPQYTPEHGGNQKAIPGAQVLMNPAYRQPDEDTDRQGQRKGDTKRMGCTIVVVERNQDRGQLGGTEDHQQYAQYAQYDPEMH